MNEQDFAKYNNFLNQLKQKIRLSEYGVLVFKQDFCLEKSFIYYSANNGEKALYEEYYNFQLVISNEVKKIELVNLIRYFKELGIGTIKNSKADLSIGEGTYISITMKNVDEILSNRFFYYDLEEMNDYKVIKEIIPKVQSIKLKP